MAKSKGTFVVLRSNTNREDEIFGPFPTHEEADGFAHKMAGQDHLGEFKVLEITDPESVEEEE